MKSYLIKVFVLLIVKLVVIYGQNWPCPIEQGNVNNSMISSDYGPRIEESWFHVGIDLGYTRGIPVYTVEQGTALWNDRTVNAIKVTHPFVGFGTDFPSRYLHCDNILLPYGIEVEVEKGLHIADVSSVGCRNPERFHLHFEFGRYGNGRRRYSPLRFLPYVNLNEPGPIVFLNIENGQTVFGNYSRKNPTRPIEVDINTSNDKDLNRIELWINDVQVDTISYDPRVNCNDLGLSVRPTSTTPGYDIFNFKWNTLFFPNGDYRLTVRAYDVRERMVK